MTAGVEVRDAEPGDVDAICAFGARVVPDHYRPLLGDEPAEQQVVLWWTPERIGESVSAGEAVVAVKDGGVVGVGERGTWEGDHVIWKLYVAPELRGRGIGRELIAGLVAQLPDDATRICVIRESLDPERTLILAYDHAFHAAYFLPEYRVVGLFPLFSNAPDAWIPSARGRSFHGEPGSTALPAVDPLPVPAGIEQVVIYDDGYLRYWPEEALPLVPLAYDVNRHLQVAALPPGGGCLDFDYRRLEWSAAGAASGCAPPAAASAR